LLTLEIYANKINAAGGIRGETIKLVIYDDASDANQSRTFATRLVEDDKVDFVIAGYGTGNSLAMLPIFEDVGIPFISLSGGVEIVEPVREWYTAFRTSQDCVLINCRWRGCIDAVQQSEPSDASLRPREITWFPAISVDRGTFCWYKRHNRGGVKSLILQVVYVLPANPPLGTIPLLNDCFRRK
jgi:hypothetical protein